MKKNCAPLSDSFAGFDYENAKWYDAVRESSERYRSRILRVSLAIGLLAVLAVAINSLLLREYWNLPILAVAGLSLGLGLFVSLKSPPRRLDLLNKVVLAVLPFAYLINTMSPGSYRTYVIVLLSMPAEFNALAPSRHYKYWLAYMVTVVVIGGLFPLLGLPSQWIADFRIGGFAVIHSAFAIILVMHYVMARQLLYYIEQIVAHIVRDPATGLPSIVALREALEKEGSKLLFIVTIANFKELATLFGNAFAENVIVSASKRLAASCASLGGTAYRLRHNDFAFLFQAQGTVDAPAVLAVLEESLTGQLILEDKSIELSFRIGYTPCSGGEAEAAIDRAREAVNIAVEERSLSAEYRRDAERERSAAAAAANLAILSRNIADQSMSLFYQPVISFAEGGTVWNEALLRFSDGKGNILPPFHLMKLATTTGHWATIEDFVLENIGQRILETGEAVSLNAGLMDLQREPFRLALENTARKAREAGSVLILELLEGDFGSADEKTLELIQSFRRSGGLVALDDFGIGYANYSRIASFPVDIVKFDNTLVNLALVDKAIAELLKGLVRFCSVRGALTVAEGLETKESVDFTRAMGFDFGQGFHWSRPVPASQAWPATMKGILLAG